MKMTLDHLDIDATMLIAEAFHDRYAHDDKLHERRLAIPFQTGTAHSMTQGWSHEEIPFTVHNLVELIEVTVMLATSPRGLTETSIDASVDEAAQITLEGSTQVDFAAAYEAQLIVNREQSTLIAELTAENKRLRDSWEGSDRDSPPAANQ